MEKLFTVNLNKVDFNLGKYTVRNFRKIIKILCHKGNVKFDDIYNFFE